MKSKWYLTHDIENQIIDKYVNEKDEKKKELIWNELELHWEQEQRKEMKSFRWWV
jgi:hypothetical protein